MMIRFTIPPALALLAALAIPACDDDPGSSGNGPEPLGDRTGAAAAMHHTRQILSFGPRPAGSPGLAKTRSYLIAQLNACGWQVGADKTTGQGPGGPVEFVSLMARFGSADEPDLWTRPVKGLLGAHMDSKFDPSRRFLGADDAASAVGTILVLARELQSEPARAAQLELVFFDGEEAFGPNLTARDGLYGSKSYAKRWLTAPQKPAFGIVLDMIGHKDLRIRYPADSPPHLVDVLTAAARAEGVSDRYAAHHGAILDDHVPLNNAGVPTIDIIGDFSNFDWWHTTRDNASILSEESLDITLRVVRRMLDELLR